ncbi:hypothetical protein ACHHYP_03053 [Achlya hypogyna]|uniref:Uncharacterized protein n=1 Tax=Achlya hypogyna TaxID=1202772 RepID=A0A1V9Z4Z1_ACHHY|nr:hypothetical protein ACHHYP_03053 [Achlya hypogyna]
MPHDLIQVDLLHLIARYLPSQDAFLAFCQAIPWASLGYPLQCWLELSTRVPLSSLWPRLLLTAHVPDAEVELYRGASIVLSNVVVSCPMDFAQLRRVVQPQARLHMSAVCLPPAPTPAWFAELAAFSVVSFQSHELGLDALCLNLHAFQHLRDLDMTRSTLLSPATQAHFFDTLTSGLPVLQSLRLRHDGLTKESLGAMTAWLTTRRVVRFGLSGGAQAAAPLALCRALQTSPTLQHLAIHQSSTGLKFCRDVATEQLRGLQTLVLRDCQLTARNVKKLVASGLAPERLDLSGNAIGDKGVQMLVEWLPSTRVQLLHLAGTGMTPKGLFALATLLRGPSTVAALYLSHEALPERSLAQFVKLTATSKSLRFLALWDVPVGVEGTMDMVDALYHSQRLELVALGASLLTPRVAQMTDSCYGSRATRFLVAAPPLGALDLARVQATLDAEVRGPRQPKVVLPSCAWPLDF